MNNQRQMYMERPSEWLHASCCELTKPMRNKNAVCSLIHIMQLKSQADAKYDM